MELRDYNGIGLWSADGIIERYREYAHKFGILSETDLTPATSTMSEIKWVYPVMDKVIEGIKTGDPACAELGIDFICESGSFPFGRILKANTAKALRRTVLSEKQCERIRQRVLHMLVNAYIPREFREYAKLLKAVGFGTMKDELARADISKPAIAKYVDSLNK